MIAAELGSCELLAYAFDKKANLNIQNKVSSILHCVIGRLLPHYYRQYTALQNGDTALLVAAKNNNDSCLRLLLDHGADPTLCDNVSFIVFRQSSQHRCLKRVNTTICFIYTLVIASGFRKDVHRYMWLQGKELSIVSLLCSAPTALWWAEAFLVHSTSM